MEESACSEYEYVYLFACIIGDFRCHAKQFLHAYFSILLSLHTLVNLFYPLKHHIVAIWLLSEFEYANIDFFFFCIAATELYDFDGDKVHISACLWKQ